MFRVFCSLYNHIPEIQIMWSPPGYLKKNLPKASPCCFLCYICYSICDEVTWLRVCIHENYYLFLALVLYMSVRLMNRVGSLVIKPILPKHVTAYNQNIEKIAICLSLLTGLSCFSVSAYKCKGLESRRCDFV